MTKRSRAISRALKSLGKVPSRAKIKARRNPTRKADYGDREHFHAWTKDRRIRLDFRRAMWVLFESDPDYWSDKGWSGVFRAVEAQGMEPYKTTVPIRKNPSRRDAVEKADALLESFSGSRASKELRARQRPIRTGLVVGKLAGVMYEADRGDGKHNYFHRFKGSSRPLLISDHDGSQLGIVGGRYSFTDRGIVDD